MCFDLIFERSIPDPQINLSSTAQDSATETSVSQTVENIDEYFKSTNDNLRQTKFASWFQYLFNIFVFVMVIVSIALLSSGIMKIDLGFIFLLIGSALTYAYYNVFTSFCFRYSCGIFVGYSANDACIKGTILLIISLIIVVCALMGLLINISVNLISCFTIYILPGLKDIINRIFPPQKDNCNADNHINIQY
ncbi:hypothetical protein DFJ63DRAFT_338636 [Scheffersomyces coipomensis]|uniref:uncharacterized protein n=1 Tax=Scheffersomyces coipomensis TaxID=1788519 RepID=UPI00315C7057